MLADVKNRLPGAERGCIRGQDGRLGWFGEGGGVKLDANRRILDLHLKAADLSRCDEASLDIIQKPVNVFCSRSVRLLGGDFPQVICRTRKASLKNKKKKEKKRKVVSHIGRARGNREVS